MELWLSANDRISNRMRNSFTDRNGKGKDVRVDAAVLYNSRLSPRSQTPIGECPSAKLCFAMFEDT